MKKLHNIYVTIFALFCAYVGFCNVAVAHAEELPDVIKVVLVSANPITIAENHETASIRGASSGEVVVDKPDTVSGEIRITRSVKKDAFFTMMLPFKPLNPDKMKGLTFYELKGVTNLEGKWKVEVMDVDPYDVTNNTPYIVMATEDMNSIVFEGGAFEPTAGEHVVRYGEWELVGMYKYKKWNEGDADIGNAYAFAGSSGNDNMKIGDFGKIAPGAYINPMRVFLRYVGEATGVRSAPSLNKSPVYASIGANLPDEIEVYAVDRNSGETTVIGTFNSRTGKIVKDRYFDLKGRHFGDKKPEFQGHFYNNGKKSVK